MGAQSGKTRVAAFVLDVGMSLLGAFDGDVPPWWVDGGDTITPASPEPSSTPDIPAAQAADLVAQLRPHSRRAYEDALTQAAYHTIPSTYVVCDLDNALPSVAQEARLLTADPHVAYRAAIHRFCRKQMCSLIC